MAETSTSNRVKKRQANYPHALVKVKAEEIYQKRITKGETGTPETDWEAAEEYYQKHPHKVLLWQLFFWWRLLGQLPELFEDSSSRAYALDVLKTVISGLTLFGTGLAAIALLLNFWDAQEERRLAQERLITDRFTKSVEQLGKVNSATKQKEETVRIGGIYALERIAIDSPKDHWTIMEVLTSYVRKESPAVASEPPPLPKASDSSEEWEKEIEKWDEWLSQNRVSIDIQAALTVIGRRESENDCFSLKNRGNNGKSEECNQRSIDLSRSNLIGANLYQAKLEGAYLIEAKLEGAFLYRAKLEGANLSEAKLEGAYLSEAKLDGANLEGAKLERANLEGAYLTGANLSEANLERANLEGANLEGAYLTGANLEGAYLTGVYLERANLSEANIERANLSEAKLEGAYLREAKLEGAYLREAKLDGAYLGFTNLQGAINLTPKQVKSACYWEEAEFTESFKKELEKEPEQNVDCSRWD